MHPELGYEEHRTAGIAAEHLERLGYRVQTGVAGTGVIGVLEGAHHHPRFDFDEDALVLGLAILAQAAASYISP